MLKFLVRARVGVKVRVRDSWGTKRPSTKRLGYEMSGSFLRFLVLVGFCFLQLNNNLYS